jgi:glycine/D-amino acid oxidase-like deaminating enzyme
MAQEYDAIVVGARCAGSPTAMLLARKGYRVLVVDRAMVPSDTVSAASPFGGVARVRYAKGAVSWAARPSAALRRTGSSTRRSRRKRL